MTHPLYVMKTSLRESQRVNHRHPQVYLPPFSFSFLLFLLSRKEGYLPKGEKEKPKGGSEPRKEKRYSHEHKGVKVLKRVQEPLYDVRPLTLPVLALPCGDEGR